MAKPLFTLKSNTQLTRDTDSGRPNSYTSIVRDGFGGLIAFYEKQWTSGRLSDGLVSALSGLNVRVSAGNGSINTTPVTWIQTDLLLPANSYSVIYVNTSGDVLQATSISSTVLKDSIVLAFIGTGAVAVVSLENVEKNGYYIFSKRQTWSGSAWVWDDYESRINTGRDPSATYNAVDDKVYLAFSRDGSSFARVLDLTDPLTWEFLPNYRLTGGIIYPEPYPSKTSFSRRSGGNSKQVITNVLFPLSAIGAGFQIGISGVERVVRVPYSSSQFNSYVIDGTTYCEIFEKVGESYNLVDSFPISKIDMFEWAQFTETADKTYYLGIRLKHTMYSEAEFRTDPAQYYALRVYANQTSFEEVYGIAPSGNIALGKLTEQSTEYGGYPSSNAVDGNLSTRSITQVAIGWWKIDLGIIRDINQIIIRKYSADRPANYKIQTADDFAFTINVIDRITVTGGASVDTHNIVPSVSARYWRLLQTGPANYLDLYEFEMYGADLPYGLIGYNARCDEVLKNSSVSGGQSSQVKTAEFDQLFRFQDDSSESRRSGSQSSQVKTAEFDQLFSFSDESPYTSRVSGSAAIATLTS